MSACAKSGNCASGKPQPRKNTSLQLDARLFHALPDREVSLTTDLRFGSKADMCSAQADVRLVPIADITA
ncbi:MAG: hypothetical protein WBC87_07625, partial [Pseudolabrys sp.]